MPVAHLWPIYHHLCLGWMGGGMGGGSSWHGEIYYYERTRLGRSLFPWEVDALAQLFLRHKNWLNKRNETKNG